MNDLRLALRLLGKSPGFTVLVVFTLAIGIGANAAMFSLVNATCLRALPYPQPGRLVHVTERSSQYSDMSVSYPNFLDWRASQDVFTGLAIYRNDGVKLKTTGGAEEVTEAQVSQDFFGVLGLRAALGRDLRPEDDRPGATPVAWLTHDAWVRYFARDPGLVGRSVMLDGVATTVAGILPAGFRFYHRADVYVPIEPVVDRQFMRERENHNGTAVVGRLKPGVTIGEARAELTGIARRLERQYPRANAGISVQVKPLRERLEGSAVTSLYLLLGAVGVVLLIACVNVANILLARSFGRSREMAIRTALGATRRDLVRQLLVESLLLAAAGGALGALIAWAAHGFLARLAPWEMQELIRDAGAFDPMVVLFVAAVTVLTGVAFGLAPAWQLSHADPNQALKNTRPALHTLFGRFRLADMLVFVQVSLAVVLLVAAGLLIRSLQRLSSVDTGLRPEHVLTLRVSTPPDAAMTRDPAAFIRHHEALLAKVQAVGGVESAAFGSALPYTWNTSSNWFYRPDRPLPLPGKFPVSNLHVVTPDYFRTLGIPLLRGALFDGHEPRAPLKPGEAISMAALPKIYAGFVINAVISRKMADEYWPGEDPIGKTFVVGEPGMHLPAMKIIGVVGNTTQTGAEDGDKVEYYTSLRQWPAAMLLHLAVRTRQDPASLVPSLRRVIGGFVPDEPVFDVALMTERIARFSADRRFKMELFAFFAGTALLLAAIGIYGVLACLVGQRTRDIGIRMALGAQRSDVLGNVVGHGLRLAVPGVVLGLVAAWAGSRVLQSQLFGITSADLPAYAASGVLLLAVALVACTVPARRAAKVNPVEALRADG